MAIRAGVIGCGFIAQYTYLPVIGQIGADHIDVVAVFDTVAERVAIAQELFPAAAGYTDFDAFLAHGGGMDLVFNLTPAPLHRSISARVLESGVSVYSEKPIAANLQEAVELAEIADAHDLQLFVAPSTITTARMVWLKERLANGDFGKAHTIKAHIGGMGPAAWKDYTGDPKVFYKKSVGPLVDLGVYMLHTITGLFGPATRVSAVGDIVYPQRTLLQDRFAGETVTMETPDVLSINLEFDGGKFANLFTTYAVVGTKAPMFELYGTEGTASVSAAQWYSGNGSTDFLLLSNTPEGGRPDWTIDVPTPNPLPIDGILESGILHAIDVIENGVGNILSPEHATHVLEIMNGAVASAESGLAVELTTTFE